MKMLSAGRVSLLGVVALAGVRVCDAARETMSVTEGGVTFTVIRYDDGRNKPYRLKFRQDDTRSLYMFNQAAQVTNVKVGTAERYEVIYDTDDNLASVEQTSSTRRDLAEEENDEDAIEGRRLEFSDCTNCAEAWDALCAGATSVCDLVDYGSPFSAAGAASVDAMCETFGSACSSYTASEACQDQCTEEEEEVTLNSCFDSTSSDYKCTFSGDTDIRFTECDLQDTDVAFLPACFEEFGKINIGSLRIDENVITAFPEDTFAGLSELTSLDLYSNKLTTVPEGLFSGLTKLEFLDLAFNDLVTLPEGALSGLESLQTLRLFANELTPETLPVGLFSGLSQLQELFLDRNELSDLTGLLGLFDGLTELVDLGLSENQLAIVPEGMFSDLTKLEELSFWINSLTAVPEGLADLPALRDLDLGDNSLTSVGGSLSGLTQLESLSLEYNDLILLEDTFSGLTNLNRLSLTGCGLTTLPAGLFSTLESLVRLDLWENGDLQCVPSNTATSVNVDSDDVLDGTCVCTPVEAVTCDEDLICESGATGYTCV